MEKLQRLPKPRLSVISSVNFEVPVTVSDSGLFVYKDYSLVPVASRLFEFQTRRSENVRDGSFPSMIFLESVAGVV